MRVLITNNTLAYRAGSELYVRDLALALLRRGHTPIAYSTNLGELARELIAATVPVVDDLDAIGEAPDIIHGHHHLDTMTALLHFDQTPAIFFCHGWIPWEEAPPPRTPRILRYLAVDDTCRDRLIFLHAIPEGEVEVLLNFVDLARFKPRRPLPDKPVKAAIFSNSFKEAEDAKIIREACARLGITLDLIGIAAGTASPTPETRLGGYDLIFAKGRAALEAAAVGNAVIVCDAAGLGSMVTASRLAEHRRFNFGIRQLNERIAVENVTREVLRYSAPDAAEVSARIRAEAGLDPAIDRLISIYGEVIVEAGSRPGHDHGAETRAASRYLRGLAPILKGRYDSEFRANQLARKVDDVLAANHRMTGERHEAEVRRASHVEQIEVLTRHAADRDEIESRCLQESAKLTELESLSRQCAETRDAHRRQLDQIASSRAWRWIWRYGRLRERWVHRPLDWFKRAWLRRVNGAGSSQ